jgi:uncharacterized protein (DUF362 family)
MRRVEAKGVDIVIQRSLKRRDFLKELGWGAVGAGVFSGLPGPVSSAAASLLGPDVQETAAAAPLAQQPTVVPARVSLIKGNDRKQIIHESLKQIEDEIFASIGNKSVLIKPNMAVSKHPLAVTHVDAVRAVLDFLTLRHKNQILIGESGVMNTLEGFRNNGYYALEREYNVKLVDLNESPFHYWYVFGKEQNPQPVRIIAPFLDPNIYLISLARMKTHDCVLVTLSLKNVLMASPLNDYKKSDKGFLHGPAPARNDILHFNLFHLAHKVYPDLAVIDGFEAMEGDGPAWGTRLEAKVALASCDPLAADTVATRVMGFDPKTVLYLSAIREGGLGQGEMDKIKILGTPLDQCLYKFKVNKRLAGIYIS